MNEGNKIFSIRGSLIEGWELTKLNIGFLIVYQMILYFLIGIFNYSGFSFFSFISVIVMILGKMGLFKSALLLTQGKKLSFNQLYIHWPLLPSWVIASLLFGILVISSIILPYLVIFLMMWLKMDAHYPFVFILISTFLIFLTIIFFLFLWTIYGFFPFFIVDKKIGPLKSLRKSEKITDDDQ